jgi:hypothetical protein
MAGFQFSESLSGTYQRDGQERKISFQVTARADSIWKFLHDRRAHLDGVIDVAGLAENAHLQGAIVIDPFLGRIIRYEFGFPGADGKSYRFLGEKHIDPLHPVETSTTLPGTISDTEGNFSASALLHFHTQDLIPFLASFRPVL